MQISDLEEKKSAIWTSDEVNLFNKLRWEI